MIETWIKFKIKDALIFILLEPSKNNYLTRKLIAIPEKLKGKCVQNSPNISICGGKNLWYWIDGPQGVQVSQPTIK